MGSGVRRLPASHAGPRRPGAGVQSSAAGRALVGLEPAHARSDRQMRTVQRQASNLRLASFSRASRACGRALSWLALSRTFPVWSDVGRGMVRLGVRRAHLVPKDDDTEAHAEGGQGQGESSDGPVPATELLPPGQHPSLQLTKALQLTKVSAHAGPRPSADLDTLAKTPAGSWSKKDRNCQTAGRQGRPCHPRPPDQREAPHWMRDPQARSRAGRWCPSSHHPADPPGRHWELPSTTRSDPSGPGPRGRRSLGREREAPALGAG